MQVFFSAIQSNDLKLSFHVSQQVEDLPGSVLLLGCASVRQSESYISYI